MSKKYPKKIQEAINRGDLILYENIFNSYSEAKKKRIREHARYLRTAMDLRKLRKKQNLSQSALAKKMHVKREFISRIESGTQNVTLETLYRIGDAMGKKVELSFK